MRRKRVRKPSRVTRRKTALSSYRSFFVLALGVLAVVFIGGAVISSLQSRNILGTTTYLAKGGDDSSGENKDSSEDKSSGSGSSGSSNSGSGGSGSSGSDSSGTGSSRGSGSGGSTSGSGGGNSSSDGSVSDDTKVDCTGPDGKHFVTKRKDCEALNRAWNKPVIFTPLQTSTTIPFQKKIKTTEVEIENEVKRTPEAENHSGIRTETEIKENETRTEVRLSEGERIRTRTKDGRTRIDITSGGVKTRLEFRDDRVIIKAEQEDGTEVELEDDTLLKIDERLGASGIKIATAGAEQFVVQRGVTGAVTNLPLSIDLATNTLTVNTPAGSKTVAVLPDQAVQNLIAANIVNSLGGQAIVEVRNNNLSSVSQLITLAVNKGLPVYEINGISNQRLLGFIPVAIQKTVTVSAQTGVVMATQESFSNSLLDLLAF